jgi:hypothetical protein
VFNWLEKIRQKPLSKRRIVAFGISLFVTGILFVVWLSVWLPSSFHTQDVATTNDQFNTPKDTMTQNFAAAWAGITDQFSALKDAVANMNLSGSAQYQATTSATLITSTTPTKNTEMSTTSGLSF